jgi:hypothetical protein
MIFAQQPKTQAPAKAVLITTLPGSSRDKAHCLYEYRLVYRQTDAEADGCLMLWQVVGGREPYQVALERDEWRQLVWHCTCPDTIYRRDQNPRHLCKHILGLLEFVPPVERPLARAA